MFFTNEIKIGIDLLVEITNKGEEKRNKKNRNADESDYADCRIFLENPTIRRLPQGVSGFSNICMDSRPDGGLNCMSPRVWRPSHIGRPESTWCKTQDRWDFKPTFTYTKNPSNLADQYRQNL